MVNNANDVSGTYAKPKADGMGICGTMAQQPRADGLDEHQSTPQKLVHLVGYRDPDARRIPWVRPTAPKP